MPVICRIRTDIPRKQAENSEVMVQSTSLATREQPMLSHVESEKTAMITDVEKHSRAGQHWWEFQLIFCNRLDDLDFAGSRYKHDGGRPEANSRRAGKLVNFPNTHLSGPR